MNCSSLAQGRKTSSRTSSLAGKSPREMIVVSKSRGTGIGTKLGDDEGVGSTWNHVVFQMAETHRPERKAPTRRDRMVNHFNQPPIFLPIEGRIDISRIETEPAKMTLINESHDSLPYIDNQLSAQARANAEKLIAQEISPDYSSSIHPSIPAFPEPRFSPLIQQELERKAAGLPLTGGIDLSRYEAPEPPARTSDADGNSTPNLDEWRQTLQKAYTASSHLAMRHENLALLEENGKNAWLIGNSQLEDILRGIEKELTETKEAAEAVNKERKVAQEASKGELVGLEESWKRGVGAILDVELAAEGLRMQILEQRRQFAQQQSRT